MSDPISHQLQANLRRVDELIAAACEKSGRTASDVQLVAVTKYTSLEVVERLVELGHVHLGENRPQQLIERSELLSDSVQWHLIGQLQRNKVRAVLPHVTLIHSVDLLRLLLHIDQVAEELNLKPRVLLQVNVSGEASKSGMSPDELRASWDELVACQNVSIQGLMTMAPLTDDVEVVRRTFAGLRELRDELRERKNGESLNHLSMGMSSDYEIALQEGATLIRLGSTIFSGCE